jgi:hypothetical protein
MAVMLMLLLVLHAIASFPMKEKILPRLKM